MAERVVEAVALLAAVCVGVALACYALVTWHG